MAIIQWLMNLNEDIERRVQKSINFIFFQYVLAKKTINI